MMEARHVLLGISCLISLISVCSCNQMDPHVYPSKGPFFEGWYMRIMDQQAGISVGWLFSRILPKSDHLADDPHPCILTSLSPVGTRCPRNVLNHKAFQSQQRSSDDLSRSNNNSSVIPYFVNAILLINPNNRSKLGTVIKYFPLSEYSITQDGHPVTHNPDDPTPPHFEAHIGKNVSFIVRPTGTTFSLTLGDTTIRGTTDNPVPWGPHGEGPEGWIDKLPLALHWFVYSLRSNVLHYEVVDKTRGILIKGGSKKGKPVLAHMEKNWGDDFPKAWIWAQAVDAKTNASFAISSGLLTELHVDIPAQVSNYRNPRKGINCKFTPVNSVHTLHHDGCAGKVNFKVTGLFCEAMFELYSKPEFFGECLTTPQVYGYTVGCVESYNAMAKVTVYERDGLRMKLTDSHVFDMVALEFGGEYMCNGKCP